MVRFLGCLCDSKSNTFSPVHTNGEGMARTQKYIALAEAAIQLRKSWPQTWARLLRGDLIGEKRNGRWYVTQESVSQSLASDADARPEAA